MSKNRISVQIEGRSYALITMDDEKYVQGIAGEVIRHIQRTAQNNKHLDTRDCAILAALDFCDDRSKAMKRSNEVVTKADQIIRQSTELNNQCAEYKEKLARAIEENQKLEKRNNALEAQLMELSKEVERLKRAIPKELQIEDTATEKKNEKLMGVIPMTQYSLFEESGTKKPMEKVKISYEPKKSKSGKHGK